MDGLSIMSVESIPLISGIIEGGSAEIDLNDAESACSSCVGSIESENYIKMVLYEIEYGDMKMVAEAYDIMTDICGMQNHEISQVFAAWNKGNLESYLIEKTAAILSENVTAKGHAIDCVSKHDESCLCNLVNPSLNLKTFNFYMILIKLD